jgi:hypothetical protein
VFWEYLSIFWLFHERLDRLSSRTSHFIEKSLRHEFILFESLIYSKKKMLHVKHCQKCEECTMIGEPVFWTFLALCKWSQADSFTIERSHQDASFDIKLSRNKDSEVKSTWVTLWPIPPIQHRSYPQKFSNFFGNVENWVQIRVQHEKLDRIKYVRAIFICV